jgi:DNA polymerase-3 subunit epsilon
MTVSAFPWPGLARKRHPLINENIRYFKELDQSRPIEEYDFVVFDTELTGLDERRDEIVSIGAVRIRNLRIVAGDTFHVHVKPAQPLPKDSTLVHRITPQDLVNAPLLDEVLPRFVEYCDKALLVGYYTALDTAFLNRFAKRILGATMRNPCIDTLRLARVHLELCGLPRRHRPGEVISYSLAGLSELYNLPAFVPHDALQDALQTAYLFLFLVKKLQAGGYRTLRQLFRAGHGARWTL